MKIRHCTGMCSKNDHIGKCLALVFISVCFTPVDPGAKLDSVDQVTGYNASREANRFVY